MPLAKILLRMSPELLETLRNAHANTYPEHRLSFNAWLVRILEKEVASWQR